MILARETYDLWRDDKDRNYYSNLIELIIHDECSVFVGAGMSVHAGFPQMSELVDYLSNSGGIELGNSQLSRAPNVLLERIKSEVEGKGDDFYELLYRRFSQDHFSVDLVTPQYKRLVQIPFNSFLTTNYDSCIEQSAGEFGGFEDVQIYPNLIPDRLNSRRLYYLHGKIDHDDIYGSAESLVLLPADYERAYSSESTLPLLLDSIFTAHNILFIGFAMKERTLEDILAQSRRRKEFIRDFPRPDDRFQKYKYAILPFMKDRIDKVRYSEEEIQIYQDKIEEFDRRLRSDYGVSVLRYLAEQDDYSNLYEIVKDLHTKTIEREVHVDPRFQ